MNRGCWEGPKQQMRIGVCAQWRRDGMCYAATVAGAGGTCALRWSAGERRNMSWKGSDNDGEGARIQRVQLGAPTLVHYSRRATVPAASPEAPVV